MSLVLEIKSGPFAGKRIDVADGHTFTAGRATGRAEFAVPHDNFMSGLHFAVEAFAKGARVVDKKSSNGTFLNGTRINESPLKDGDEIRSGQTVFVVRMPGGTPAQTPAASPSSVPASPPQQKSPAHSPLFSAQPAAPVQPVSPSPRPVAPIAPPSPQTPATPSPSANPQSSPAARPSNIPASIPQPAPQAPAVGPTPRSPNQAPALKVGSWLFYVVPQGWEPQPDFGLQQASNPGEFPGSIVVMEEQLGPGITLATHVESQIGTLRQYLREPQIDPASPPNIEGAEEAVALEVRHKTKDGTEVYYRRIYVRRGGKAGVLTLTTLVKNAPQLVLALQPVWAGLGFRP